MGDLRRWPARLWLRAALIAGVVAAVLYVIVAAWTVLVPFIIGAILAWIVLPAVMWIERHLPRSWERHGISRLIAIFAVYAVVLALVVAFFAVFVPRVIAQAAALLSRGPELLGGLSSLVSAYERLVPVSLRALLATQLPSTPQGWLDLIRRDVLGGLTSAVSIPLIVILAYVTVPFWLIYLIYDVERFRRAGLSLFPEGSLPDVANIGRILNEVAGDYLRGQVFVAVTVGILIGGAFYLVGIEFAVVLGVLAAIGDLIPTFGPVLAAIPAVIIAAFERPILALWAILITIGVHEFENLFIGPRVVGASVRIRPAVIIVLLIIAGYLWGLLGLLLVVPITAVLRDVFQYAYLRTQAVPPDEALRRVRRSWRQRGPWGEHAGLA
ncbi:MAG TPA: AI-2E family transporter [Anaerolineae bacterium]|nr:AI-2E family transporter [Anaerolineae bacterium]HPL27809.1 AI-2E family transporter [Anaerolineae bacterium]